MNVDTIPEWIKFVDSSASPSSPDGLSPAAEMPPTSVFGLYAQRLRDDIFHYLVVILPSILELSTASPIEPTPAQGTGRETLLRVFSSVPFEMFKSAVESPSFQIGESFPRMPCYLRSVTDVILNPGSDQARFKFAKDAIDLRKRARGSSAAEETVVLAFGGASFGGSAVHITRKVKKRPLWKVNA